MEKRVMFQNLPKSSRTCYDSTHFVSPGSYKHFNSGHLAQGYVRTIVANEGRPRGGGGGRL